MDRETERQSKIQAHTDIKTESISLEAENEKESEIGRKKKWEVFARDEQKLKVNKCKQNLDKLESELAGTPC